MLEKSFILEIAESINNLKRQQILLTKSNYLATNILIQNLSLF